ncbi:50S ribosomal protein L24 [Pseudobacteriovorax antillogorgiicola]|uniref:Large ribosomal subunit protein uL24 n=1 Tax=Pseudobacteriovorax antillogorgiicola TaxID=1513793 RepID=A0A1Y6BTM8_9BACT|nr:50S ribosomal protein L24 [Pseudobacteriovorax antillogorgiicola]TCS53899.1 LSU ribosomal protein L24P [Pseudobacteriovorax antillogorgiicola]SMF20802.1 LSU ribosomal protein L24P [Pseudobacteriovorax antillogorgiicola]
MAEQTKYQVKCKLVKGDEVVVLTGKSKGETGKIDRVSRKSGKVYVGGVNLAKRHTRPGTTSEEGGILDKAMPLDISNVALVDPKTKKPTRVGYKLQDGKKVRFAKASGTVLS